MALAPGQTSGLVYQAGATLPHALWYLDLATGATWRLSDLDPRGDIRTFDSTPDGSAIVFDRIQQNAEVVLIELP